MPHDIAENRLEFQLGFHNVALIGMPGAGKSTVGVRLARSLGYGFIDTDRIIQVHQKKSLQQIIDRMGLAAFHRIEECAILAVRVCGHVIATGGSVVYSDRAMRHLQQRALVCYLHVRPAALQKRINDLDSRGIAMKSGQTLSQLYDQRLPLYRKYADLIVECTHKSPSETLREIFANLRLRNSSFSSQR